MDNNSVDICIHNHGIIVHYRQLNACNLPIKLRCLSLYKRVEFIKDKHSGEDTINIGNLTLSSSETDDY